MLVAPARTALIIRRSRHPFHGCIGCTHNALAEVIEAVREVGGVDGIDVAGHGAVVGGADHNLYKMNSYQAT